MKADFSKSERFSVNVFDLDQSAVIYPNIGSPKLNQVFRIEAVLDSEIDPNALERALEKVRRRMPSFFVRLYKSRLKYQLCRLGSIDGIICPEPDILCKSFDISDLSIPLIRVTFRDNRLGVEFFHSVTDGNGGSVFFKTLVRAYFIELGEEIPLFDGILNCDDIPDEEESSDAFQKVFEGGGKTISRAESMAFQYGKEKVRKPLEIVEFRFPVEELKAVSKRYESTVTQLLVAVYTSAFCNSEEGKNTRKSIKISVPIDLRPRFSTKSLRNFSLYLNSEIKPKTKDAGSLKNMIAMLKNQFAERTDKGLLQNMAYTNVKQANMTIFKKAPRSVKKAILVLGNKIYGERLFTSSMSNLKSIDLPAELEKHILSFRFVIGETLKNNINTTVSTYKKTVSFVMSSRVDATEIYDYIGNFLKDEGINYQLVKE